MGSVVDALPPPAPDPACCTCGFRRCCPAGPWHRSVKRRLEKVAEDGGSGCDGDGGGVKLHVDVAARVDVENEAVVLREALAGHQQTVAELCAELEEERAASASAASETMSMILRLQREKAEVQMEARQFKRFAAEKMAHDQQELLVLDDLVYRREQALQALSCEVQAYRHRLLSYGVDPDSLPLAGDEDSGLETPVCDYPAYDYPSLRCCGNPHQLDSNIEDDNGGENGATDLDRYPPGEVLPGRREQLQKLEQRINQLERTPSEVSVVVNEMEKGVVVGQSPRRWASHAQQLSMDSFGSPLAKVPTLNGKQQEEFPSVDGSSEFEGDDDCDRVYTIDAVHRRAPTVGVSEDHVGSPRDPVCRAGGLGDADETDIKKLYARLQVLEADRESMRQAIIAMRTDKAQLMLLKEIAQQLCRDASLPPPYLPSRKLVKKASLFGRFSFMSMIKWVVSFVFWRKTTRQSKYTFGLSDKNVGLLILLEKAPKMGQWRCLSRIQN